MLSVNTILLLFSQANNEILAFEPRGSTWPNGGHGGPPLSPHRLLFRFRFIFCFFVFLYFFVGLFLKWSTPARLATIAIEIHKRAPYHSDEKYSAHGHTYTEFLPERFEIFTVSIVFDLSGWTKQWQAFWDVYYASHGIAIPYCARWWRGPTG